MLSSGTPQRVQRTVYVTGVTCNQALNRPFIVQSWTSTSVAPIKYGSLNGIIANSSQIGLNIRVPSLKQQKLVFESIRFQFVVPAGAYKCDVGRPKAILYCCRLTGYLNMFDTLNKSVAPVG